MLQTERMATSLAISRGLGCPIHEAGLPILRMFGSTLSVVSEQYQRMLAR
jgi:hypothetical protein